MNEGDTVRFKGNKDKLLSGLYEKDRLLKYLRKKNEFRLETFCATGYDVSDRMCEICVELEDTLHYLVVSLDDIEKLL